MNDTVKFNGQRLGSVTQTQCRFLQTALTRPVLGRTACDKTRSTHLLGLIDKSKLVFRQVLRSSVLVVVFILVNFDLICGGQIVSVSAASHSVHGSTAANLRIQFRYVLFTTANIKLPSKKCTIISIGFQQ